MGRWVVGEIPFRSRTAPLFLFTDWTGSLTSLPAGWAVVGPAGPGVTTDWTGYANGIGRDPGDDLQLTIARDLSPDWSDPANNGAGAMLAHVIRGLGSTGGARGSEFVTYANADTGNAEARAFLLPGWSSSSPLGGNDYGYVESRNDGAIGSTTRIARVTTPSSTTATNLWLGWSFGPGATSRLYVSNGVGQGSNLTDAFGIGLVYGEQLRWSNPQDNDIRVAQTLLITGASPTSGEILDYWQDLMAHP